MDIKAKKEDKSVSFIISSNYFFKLDIENIDEKRDVVDKNKFGILISRLTGEEKEHLTRIFLRLIYIFLFYLIT